MSRRTAAYASAYQQRDHESHLSKGDVLGYSCDFNGALNGESIVALAWETDRSCVTVSGLTVSGGIASAAVAASDWGCTVMTVKATTSAGRKLSQRFVVDVEGGDVPVASVSWP